jgi:hypothetical protein
MSYGLGVDLGTTFTGVAVGAHDQTRIVTIGDSVPAAPAVAAPQAAGDLLLRGGDLLVRAGIGTTRSGPEPGLGEPVPLALGGRPHREVPELAGVLRTVLSTVTSTEGQAPAKVVLTCPAVWGPVRRRQFGEVSRQAGVHLVSVVSEPEAATAYFVQAGRLGEGDVVAVYDLGAATVDLTVVRVSESGAEILGQPEALEGVGGIDFDAVVMAHVDGLLGGAISALNPDDPVEQAVLEGVRAECRRAKEALSWAESTTVSVGFVAEEVRVGLSRVEFEAMIRVGLESTLTGLRRSMRSAGVELADLRAVVLVGGSSRIPLVERILTNGLGRPLLVPDYPQHCVVLGAATIAGDVRPRSSSTASSVAATATLPAVTETAAGSGARSRGRSAAGSGSDSRSAARGRRVETVPEGENRNQSRGGERDRDKGWDRRRVVALAVTTVLLLAWGAYFVIGSGPGDPEPDLGTVGPSAGPAADPAGSSDASGAAGARITPKAVAIRKARPAPVRPPAPKPLTGTGALIGPAGKCLDVAGAQNADGTPVQLFTCNGTDAQVWTAASDGSLRALGKCLQSTGARLQISTCDGSPTQRWRVASGGIRLVRTKQCVAVLGAPDDLAPVGFAGCEPRAGQRWKLAG